MIDYQHEPVTVTHHIRRTYRENGTILVKTESDIFESFNLGMVIDIGKKEKILDLSVFFNEKSGTNLSLSTDLMRHIVEKRKDFVFPLGCELVVAMREVLLPGEEILLGTSKSASRVSAVPSDSLFIATLSSEGGIWVIRKTPDVATWVSEILTSNGITSVPIPTQYTRFENVPVMETSSYRTIFQIN